jgi:hypothetical protein
MKNKKHSFFYRNGLSIVLISMMLVFLGGQFYTGHIEHNEELAEKGLPQLNAGEYFTSGHFLQATFENWESEFLQMAIYVLLTVSLRQKGSSESKKLDEKEEVDREPEAKPDAPWPVKKGGIWLKLYKSSLSIVFILLFLISFALHFKGSYEDNYLEKRASGHQPETWSEYATSSRFWFESFQNWQSEFLAVASIVLLSIWFRQKGSPESKPVDASYDDTGTS